ncbi:MULTISPECIES: 5-bromo-4-chloroindolyl phosphate hydrolysis family protein [Aneurinibacillus]|nr:MULTISPECIES: 5-bromo-4-chloroindolyl phosphate hydrolysis family protein [Aneurinibacillus]AMA71533.1 hypothetical protein ACH33_00910 [Aneurinibacillus sp. XH2]MED0675174.1 5-bromo-4-chloroindolyl phosphate hydrolysis family protein [Aneurinibacillus thermoaerophilus]MED0677738.1 5-bromo-4-chloroindolyl phosphate hydrolysis family protein [Aneurinibacillus thermoaerophilus]MED0735731.1 5-bromo-4-chloroindolyl phosphate hydrolysis family protein [Aneurinibacillus thermoaerophilus]MED075854
MKEFFTNVWCVLLSSTIGLVSSLVFFILFDEEFIPVFLLSVATFALSMWIVKRRYRKPQRYNPEMDKHERAYIKQSLREAQRKLKTIRRLQFRIRSIIIWKKTSHLYKVARRILIIIEEQPHRFRFARNFFASYLDSTITILEKYTFLASQPIHSQEMVMALKKAEAMLDDIIAALEEELMQVLSDDVLNLNVELETLKKSLGIRPEYVIKSVKHEEYKDKMKR